MSTHLTYLLVFSLLILSCHPIKKLTKSIDCQTIEEILGHPEVQKTLKLDEPPEWYNKIRVFHLDEMEIHCEGMIGKWPYVTLSGIRPSINTGYHRDVFYRVRNESGSAIHQLYLASHENYLNRQTTYLLEFVRENPGGLGGIKLIGFAEYTDN